MVDLVEMLWRVLDVFSQLWDLVVNWRLWVCIFLALAVVLVAGRMGLPTDLGTFILAATVGLVVGLAWELLSAAARRGYV